jgi:hypothetical protein
MKRLMCMLAVLGATLWFGSAAQAEFRGLLFRNEGWMLNVDSAAVDDPGTAITIHLVFGRRDVVVVRTVPAHERTQISFPAPLPDNVRIVIEVDPSLAGTAGLEVVQGDRAFQWMSDGFSRAVFDVADATS